MAISDATFVRREMAQSLPPPATEVGILGWTRHRLLSGWPNVLLTLAALYLLWIVVPPVVRFLFIDAVWEGDRREACLGPNVGACWAYVRANFATFIYGRYPDPERWRVNIVFLLGVVALVPLAIPTLPYKGPNAVFALLVFPVIAFVLLTGSPMLGLPVVETPLWGGLLVTLVVAVTGIVASLPLGVLLALGRRSRMPITRLLSIAFIEFWRGVPLITVLFMASVMLPLFMPVGLTVDKLLRALIGVALFSAAYMAEVVRGGLQAIPRGQYEGAMALGLGYWTMMYLIVLPQALKLVIPGIVNTFIGLFKDTTLVLIIGIFDLLGQVEASLRDPYWATPVTSYTGYAFAGFVFFVFCFGMSRYSLFVERRVDAGRKR